MIAGETNRYVQPLERIGNSNLYEKIKWIRLKKQEQMLDKNF